MLASAPLTVDVGEREFMDSGTLAELHRIAMALPSAARITPTGASPQLQRIVEIAGWQHPRLKVLASARPPQPERRPNGAGYLCCG